MQGKLTVWILFWGKSTEHEVSIISARNVLDALDKQKFDPVLIGIDKSGTWMIDPAWNLLDESVKSINFTEGRVPVTAPAASHMIQATDTKYTKKLDVIFPVLHGPLGEDWTVQGLLKLADIPFVWPDVLGSAVCMDKDVTKRLLDQTGIAVAPWITVRKWETLDDTAIIEQLWLPLFVKPANAGSSVGVHKVTSKDVLLEALEDAWKYDTKILIEWAIIGKEIECAVLGNHDPKASVCGEITPVGHEFYSYESKYLDDDGYQIDIPARISDVDQQRIQKIALKSYTVLECTGMARVDVFLQDNWKIIVNEVNTIPGFTSISMYPKLREASGVWYTDLITTLLELAIERYQEQQWLASSYNRFVTWKM